MRSEEIKRWVDEILPLLDAPDALIPEINSVTNDWEVEKDSAKVCILTPCELRAAISNLGVAIMYDLINKSVGMFAERAYYPEPKLKRRLLKHHIPLFSKETRRPLREFDCVAISSYYPIQMFAFPELLKMGGMRYWAKDRVEEDPLILVAGNASLSPAPFVDFVDAVFVGEGEEQGIKAFEILQEEKYKKGNKDWKLDTLLRWSREVEGMYIPHFYEEVYGEDGRLINHVVKEEYMEQGVPSTVIRATHDFTNTPPLTKMFVPNSEGNTMASGSVMITSGCSNACSFCHGSWTAKPYRELPIETAKKAFVGLIKETGVTDVSAYAFNLSDYSQVNDLLYWLLADQGRRVSMSTQRIDYFSPDFAKTAKASGSSTVTLAIECGSQRLRDGVSKNLTEAMIIDAFRTAFQLKFSAIKIYMIVGLPEAVQDEDVQETVRLFRRLREVQLEEQGSYRTRIRVSYTKFTAKSATPLQWAASGECDPETGLPIFDRNLRPVLDACKDYNWRFRSSTPKEISVLCQVLTHGDRRMSKVVEEVCFSDKFKYRGGMSVGSGPMEPFQEILHKHGMTYAQFINEKPLDTYFPWDFIDFRVKREYLVERWKDFKEARPHPICFDSCANCGACSKDDLKRMAERQRGEQPQDRTTLAEVMNFKRKQPFQLLRAKFTVPPQFRYIHGSKIKLRIIRTLLQEGSLNFLNRVTLASDMLKYRNWTFGTDYFEVPLTDKPLWEGKFSSEKDIALALNEKANEVGIFISEARLLSTDTLSFKRTFGVVLYEIRFPSKQIAHKVAQEIFTSVLNSDSFRVKVMVKDSLRQVWVTEEIEARDMIHNLWAEQGDKETIVRMLLSERIGPYEILPPLFKTSKRAVLVHPAEVLEYCMATKQGELNMFASLCEKCGEEIQETLFGIPVTENRCIRHLQD